MSEGGEGIRPGHENNSNQNKIPEKYQHDEINFVSPLQEATLDQITDQKLKKDHAVDFIDLKKIISSEIEDIKDQQRESTKGSRDDEKSQSFSDQIDTKQNLLQDLDFVINTPSERGKIGTENLQKYIDLQLKRAKQKLSLNPDSDEEIRLSGHFTTFKQLEDALKRYTETEIKSLKEVDKKENAFENHPFFQQLNHDKYVGPQKEEMLQKLEKKSRIDNLDFVDVTNLLNAELTDSAHEFTNLKSEVALAKDFFDQHPNDKRFTVYVKPDGSRTTEHKSDFDDTVSASFYERSKLGDIDKRIKEVKQETDDGKPPVLAKALAAAEQFEELENKTKLTKSEKNNMQALGTILTKFADQTAEPLTTQLMKLRNRATERYNAAIPEQERPLLGNFGELTEAMKTMRASDTNPF